VGKNRIPETDGLRILVQTLLNEGKIAAGQVIEWVGGKCQAILFGCLLCFPVQLFQKTKLGVQLVVEQRTGLLFRAAQQIQGADTALPVAAGGHLRVSQA